MKKEVTEEMLMAYADGELSQEQAAEIERLMERDPKVRATVEEFRRTSDLASLAFSAPMSEAPPAHLVDLIRGDRPKLAAATSRPKTPWRQRALPMAASLVLAAAIGYGLATTLSGPGGKPGGDLAIGPVEPRSTLAELLETQPAGSERQAADGHIYAVVSTFRAPGGRACREFEQLKPAADGTALPRAAAIACRAAERSWTIEGVAHIAPPSAATPDGYAPAGASEEDALSGLVRMLNLSPALSPEDEKRQIETGWRKP